MALPRPIYKPEAPAPKPTFPISRSNAMFFLLTLLIDFFNIYLKKGVRIHFIDLALFSVTGLSVIEVQLVANKFHLL